MTGQVTPVTNATHHQVALLEFRARPALRRKIRQHDRTDAAQNEAMNQFQRPAGPAEQADALHVDHAPDDQVGRAAADVRE